MLETLPLTAEKRRMVAQIRDGLCRVAGIQAVVLGGSQARGLARPDSDLHASVTCMREIWTDTVELTNGIYQARYAW
jgi:predicted nucleotidyltransferase